MPAITGTVSGRNLVANIGKDVATGSITFAFKTITPHRMGTYTIPVSSSLHVIHQSRGAPIPIKITIGAVVGGTGAYTVTRSNGALYFQAPPDPRPLRSIRRIKAAISPLAKTNSETS